MFRSIFLLLVILGSPSLNAEDSELAYHYSSRSNYPVRQVYRTYTYPSAYGYSTPYGYPSAYGYPNYSNPYGYPGYGAYYYNPGMYNPQTTFVNPPSSLNYPTGNPGYSETTVYR